MKRLFLLLVCLVAPALAQSEYVVLQEDSLTAAASVVTIQAPATNAARLVRFEYAYVYCSVACDVILERSGTAATTTAATPTPIVATSTAAKTKAFTASNVGTGTVLGKYTIPAGGTGTIDVSSLGLNGAGTTKNLTLRTSSITGTARIGIQFREDN